MMWTVYVLECADGTYYTGSTTNIERRLRQHQLGKGAKYTRGRRPVRCCFLRQYLTRADAQRIEAGIKRGTRAQKDDVVRGTLRGEAILKRLERSVRDGA